MRPIGGELVTTITSPHLSVSQQPSIWEPPSHYSMLIPLSNFYQFILMFNTNFQILLNEVKVNGSQNDRQILEQKMQFR